MIDPEMVGIAAARVRDRIRGAGGDGVQIVAVTKGFGADAIEAARAAQLAVIGESYAQESLAKLPLVTGALPEVHFIGRLQRNKVRKLAPFIDTWQSVDRAELGVEIAKHAPGANVMVQVNISNEAAKGGCGPDEVPTLVETLKGMGLAVEGLMGVALLAEPAAARPGFRVLRELVDQLGLSHCSMGMSADLEVAVQEGSTMVRIGRDLFGERP